MTIMIMTIIMMMMMMRITWCRRTDCLPPCRPVNSSPSSFELPARVMMVMMVMMVIRRIMEMVTIILIIILVQVGGW